MTFQRLSHLLGVCLVTLTTGAHSPVYADDTEIYLGEATNASAVKNNILFVLDTSFSMKNAVKVDNNGDGDTNDPGENLGSRISVLQDAMNSIITGLDNANVGYVRMNGSESPTKSGTSAQCNQAQLDAGASEFKNNQIQTNNSGKTDWSNKCYLPTGGAVMFPIADLDAAASVVPGEPNEFGIEVPVSIHDPSITPTPAFSTDDAQQTNGAASTDTNLDAGILDIGSKQCATENTISVQIAASADDAHEKAGGVVNPSGNVKLGEFPTGFRFQNITIDDDDQIISANITFTLKNDSSDDIDVTFKGGVNKGTTPDSTIGFSSAANINARATTTASVDWIGVPTGSAGDELVSPDLSSIIQELVDETGPGTWDSTDAIVFLLDEDTGNAGNSGRSVEHFNSDATKSAKLDITYCDTLEPATGPAQTERAGFRFQNVGVPQGAVIMAAYIDFTAAPPTLNTDASNLAREAAADSVRITANTVDDSVTFAATAADDVDNRDGNDTSGSAEIQWRADQMGTWVEGDKYTTPDLKTMVTAVVDRAGWCGGNDMTFVFEGIANTVSRRVYGFDSDPGNAPVLRIEYDPTFSGSDTGCDLRSYTIPIAQSNHDAGQNNSNNKMFLTSTNPSLAKFNSDTVTTGFIFELPVEKDTTIISANLQLSASGNNASAAGTSAMLINAENTGDAANFSAANNDLSPATRARITGGSIPAGGVPWNQGPVGDNETFFTSDISSLLDEVTSHADWAYNNRINIIVDANGTGGIQRKFKSFDGNASRAAKLNIVVQENDPSNTSTAKTVRERLLEINDTFTTSTLLGWTPSTETLYEAALYWRGKDVFYGKERGAANLPNPTNGVDYRIKMERTTTSHPGSYTGGTYNDGADDGNGAGGGTDCELQTTTACLHDSITGTPTYISPIDAGLECAGNYQIFLTDGAPTSVAQSTIDAITGEFSDISSCSTAAADNKKGQQGSCAVEMAKSLHDNDQSTFHDGDQNVVTYTIAFNLGDTKAKEWLEQISAAGGGASYEATSATDLLNAFDEIFNDIVSRPTSFVAPSIAANSFNRLFSRDEVYFGMFIPTVDVRWQGNVKKFRVCDDTDVDDDGTPDCTLGDIMQSDNVTSAVVDVGTEEGLFRTDAVSVWSALQGISATDDLGREVSAGGAGGTLTDYTTRTIYTDVRDDPGSPGTDLSATQNQSLGLSNSFVLNNTTWDDANMRPVREEICPTNETDADVVADTTQCIDYIQWVLGKDVLDEDEDGDIAETRWSFSDVLHSSPVTVTYGQTAGNEFIDKVIVGTNEGGLRFLNGTTGVEEWVFMPNSLLENNQQLYANPSSTHTYGFDGSPVLRIHDANQDGTIDPSTDFVHVYLGMRRGGDQIYALDITPAATLTATSGQIVPKFLWKIDGGAGDFSRLGQTWSDPILATIGTTVSSVNNTPTDVLIFGGGYDANLDTSYGITTQNPNQGNSIYIVDADTGAKLTDISSDTSADINPPLMKHSIPSEVKVIDVDGDGLDDRIYVGDMGGNVWRVDLGGDITAGSAGSSVVGRLASVADNGINGDTTADDGLYESAATQRRFFVPPSVVQVSDDIYSDVKDYDYVLMPAGQRNDPLDLDVSNRFYAFKDTTIGNMTSQGGGNVGLADEYPQASEAPIIDDGSTTMIDITAVSTTGVGLDPTNASHKAALGWYLDFDTVGAAADRTDGEKGLAAPTTIQGTVVFTTYVPESSTPGVCDAAEGSGRAFNLNIVAATPSLDWDGDDNTTNDAGDLFQDLGAGIPSEAVPIFTEEGVTLLVGTGGGAENLGQVADLPRFRTYWYQEEG